MRRTGRRGCACWPRPTRSWWRPRGARRWCPANVWSPRARVAGAHLEAHAWPAAIAGGTLIVHVHDSQWLHELTYLRQDLLRRLQALAPAAELGALRLRLGEVLPVAERPQPEPIRWTPLPPPRLSPEPDEETRRALDAVHDPELKQILAGARIMLGRS